MTKDPKDEIEKERDIPVIEDLILDMPPGVYSTQFVGETPDGLFWIARITEGEYEGRIFKLPKPRQPMEFSATHRGPNSVN